MSWSDPALRWRRSLCVGPVGSQVEQGPFNRRFLASVHHTTWLAEQLPIGWLSSSQCWVATPCTHCAMASSVMRAHAQTTANGASTARCQTQSARRAGCARAAPHGARGGRAGASGARGARAARLVARAEGDYNTGFVDTDSGGKSNVFGVEPTVYVAGSAMDAQQNNGLVTAFAGLLSLVVRRVRARGEGGGGGGGEEGQAHRGSTIRLGNAHGRRAGVGLWGHHALTSLSGAQPTRSRPFSQCPDEPFPSTYVITVHQVVGFGINTVLGGLTAQQDEAAATAIVAAEVPPQGASLQAIVSKFEGEAAEVKAAADAAAAAAKAAAAAAPEVALE